MPARPAPMTITSCIRLFSLLHGLTGGGFLCGSLLLCRFTLLGGLLLTGFRLFGGLLFFRPIALYPFAKVSVRIKEHYDRSYSQIIEDIPNELLWIQNRLWKKGIWDDVAKKMVMGNATQIELMLLYIVAPELLTAKEKRKMIDNLKSIWDEPDTTVVQERLDGIIRGDEYV